MFVTLKTHPNLSVDLGCFKEAVNNVLKLLTQSYKIFDCVSYADTSYKILPFTVLTLENKIFSLDNKSLQPNKYLKS